MVGSPLDLRLMAAYLLDQAWRRRWLVLGLTWALCLVGWAAVVALPDRFTVTARLYVDTETVLMPLMKGIAVQSDLGKIVNVMRRTLLSRPNMERLLRMTDIDLSLNSDLAREEFIAALQKRILIDTQASAAQLYTVSFEDSNPQLAQKVVASLLTIFVEQNVGNKRRDVESALQFISNQINEYEGRLRSAEGKLAQFRQAHAQELGLRQNAAGELQNAESDLRRLETDRQALIWRRDQMRLELAQTPDFLGGADASRLAAAPTSAAERVTTLRNALATLLLTRTERHPDVVLARRQLENAESDLARHGGGQRADGTAGGSGRLANPAHARLDEELKRLETDLAVAERRLESGRNILAEQRQRMESVPEVEQQLTQLNRDYDILRKNYDELVSRRESVRMAQSMENSTRTVDFRVIDPPVVPLAPSGPNRVLLLAAVLVAALALSLGLTVLQYVIKEPFIDLGHLHHISGLPVLGGLSRVAGVAHGSASLPGKVALALGLGTLVLLFGGLLYLAKISAVHLDLVELAGRLSDLASAVGQFVSTIVSRLKAGF